MISFVILIKEDADEGLFVAAESKYYRSVGFTPAERALAVEIQAVLEPILFKHCSKSVSLAKDLPPKMPPSGK